MRGHVRKRGATWTVVYDEGRDERGRRMQRWRGGFATKREAEAFLASTVSSIGDGSYVPPSKLLFSDYLDTWLENVADSVRPLTLRRYQSTIEKHLKPALGQVLIQGLTPARFKSFHRDLRAAGLAESSIAVFHAVAHRALADAVEDNLILRNPAGFRKAAPKAGSDARRRANVWTARELRTFLDHVADVEPRLFPLWRLAAMSGMRRGELLGLTWQALDLEGARLTVSQQLIPLRGGASFGPPKSKRSHRMIALDAESVDVLRAHRQAQLLERAFMGEAYEEHDLVFAREDGSPIHPQRLTEQHGVLVKGAKVPAIRFHDLRHGHATACLTNGVPLHVVAARIGDRPETMLATYAHLLPTSDAEAAERVAALIT
jgi:integrase